LDLADNVAPLDISSTPLNDLSKPQQLPTTMLPKVVEAILEIMAEEEMAGRRNRRKSEAKIKSASLDPGSTQFDCATLWQPLQSSHQSLAILEIPANAVMIYGST